MEKELEINIKPIYEKLCLIISIIHVIFHTIVTGSLFLDHISERLHFLIIDIYRLLPLVLVLNIVFAAVAYVRCEKLRLVGISILITGLDLLLGGTVVFAIGYGIHFIFELLKH